MVSDEKTSGRQLSFSLSLSFTIVDLSFFSGAFARDSTPPSSSILLMTKLWAGARAKLRLSSETCKEQCVCVYVSAAPFSPPLVKSLYVFLGEIGNQPHTERRDFHSLATAPQKKKPGR
jgi:hypothetical protein